MFSNYFKVALRNLLKNKGFTLVNIMGLSIGIVVSLMIVRYVSFETSFDTFHPDAEALYRVTTINIKGDEVVYQDAMSFNTVGKVLVDEFPSVTGYARAFKVFNGMVFRVGDDLFPGRKAVFADPSFLELFNHPVTRGTPNGLLSKPFTVVLTESTAQRYFGNQDPIDQVITVPDGQYAGDYSVVGVVQDPPGNTHFTFDMLIAYSTFFRIGVEENWQGFNDYVYIKTVPGADMNSLKAAMPALTRKYLGEESTLQFHLQRVLDIHLTSNMAYEAEVNGDKDLVDFILLVGIFILLIAWVNYVNLSTAKSLERAKEVGLRKVIGAQRKQLILQFLADSALFNLVSVLVALTFIQVLSAHFNEFIGRPLPMIWTDMTFWQALALVLIIGTLLSGLYPAFLQSSFRPLTVLKGSFKNSKTGVFLRKGLVVLQFIASTFLIAATVIVYNQLQFMKNHDLGMDLEHVLVLKAPPTDNDFSRFPYISAVRSVHSQAYESFRNEASKMAGIQAVSASGTIPAGGITNVGSLSGGLWWEKRKNEERLTYYLASIDETLFEVYDMQLLAGRTFSNELRSDTAAVVINESALRLLNFDHPEQAIGERLVGYLTGSNWFRVVGVLKDFNRLSLKHSVEPTLYYYNGYNNAEYFALKLTGRDPSEKIGQIQELWQRHYPDAPFEYHFADNAFDAQYESDQRLSKVFLLFAALAILIACLGLYGLSYYMSVYRIKEIGVRKVLGASVANVLLLLSKGFVQLAAVSFVLSIPLVLWIMNQWLDSYAYQVEIAWWMILVSGGIVLTVVLLTVSYHAGKTAVSNPAQSLRYE